MCELSDVTHFRLDCETEKTITDASRCENLINSFCFRPSSNYNTVLSNEA